MNSVRTFCLIVGLLCGPAAYAVEPLSVSLVAPNLSGLTIGSPVNIGVELSGLGAGDSLDYLAATVSFNGSLFSTPIISGGSSVPDSAGFVSHASAGLADGSYDSLGSATAAEITQNGRLFSFSVTPVAAGSGAFVLQFVDALGAVATGVPIDGIAAGNSLPFSVVVPEPSSLVLVCSIVAAIFCRIRRR